MAANAKDDIDSKIAKLERAIASLRQKKERQRAAADDTEFQIDMFEQQVAKLKGGR